VTNRNSEYRGEAPSPVLYGDVGPKQPSVVRDVRLLCVLAMLLTGIGIAMFMSGYYENPRKNADMISLIAVYSMVFALQMAMFRGLGHRKKLAWQAQILISGFGVLGFPIGTLIHGFVLSKWFKPEVKDWFGIPVTTALDEWPG